MNFPIDAPVAMPDVQSRVDLRHMPIERVGVRGVHYPILVALDSEPPLATIAQWELTVCLPAHEKGTHMSRFVALLDEYRQVPMTPMAFCDMARKMLPLLNAKKGDISATFPYFMRKAAPVSGVASLMDYEVKWVARADGDAAEFELSIVVPVTTLCPCSKAISNHGAHNQRSHVTVTAIFSDPAMVDVQALVRMVEEQASCELWGLLKRIDEKFVTERAYDNPKFVEDIVRDVAVRIKDLSAVRSFRVQAENFESIHNHSAYAAIEA